MVLLYDNYINLNRFNNKKTVSKRQEKKDILKVYGPLFHLKYCFIPVNYACYHFNLQVF